MSLLPLGSLWELQDIFHAMNLTSCNPENQIILVLSTEARRKRSIESYDEIAIINTKKKLSLLKQQLWISNALKLGLIFIVLILSF